MKKLVIISLLSIMSYTMWGQTVQREDTLYQVCENKLYNMLIQDGIINDYSTDKEEKLFNKHIKNTYKSLLPNNSPLLFQKIEHHFRGKSIENVFSKTYLGELSRYTIDNNTSYELPNPLKSFPIYLMSKQDDNYLLNINSSNIMAHALEGKFEGKMIFIEGKASTALKKSKDKQKNLDVFLGRFENRIGKLFYDFNNNILPDEDKGNEWHPFFVLWNLYHSQKDFRDKYSDYNVIRRFYGMITSNSERSSVTNSTDIETTIKLNLNYMSFLDSNFKSDFSLSKSKSGVSEENNFDVYMVKEDEFPIETTRLPSMESIKTNWESSRNCSVIYPDNNVYFLNENTFDLSLLFGPVPFDDISQIRCMSPDVFVDEIQKPQIQMVDESIDFKGIRKYSMKVTLNEDEFKQLQSENNLDEEIDKVITFVCGFGNLEKEEERLAYTYNVKIKIDLKPYIIIKNSNVQDIFSRIIGSKIEYKIPINYEIIQRDYNKRLSNVRIDKGSFSDKTLNIKEIKSISKLSTGRNPEYIDTLFFITDANTITNDNFRQNLEFDVNFKEGSRNYLKKASMSVYFPEIKETSVAASPSKTFIEDIKTVFVSDLDLSKLDSTFSVDINEKSFQISSILSTYRNNINSTTLTIDNETIETEKALNHTSEVLRSKKVILPVAPNMNGLFIMDNFKKNE